MEKGTIAQVTRQINDDDGKHVLQEDDIVKVVDRVDIRPALVMKGKPIPPLNLLADVWLVERVSDGQKCALLEANLKKPDKSIVEALYGKKNN